eukprot:CAMPEP_0114343896 /NCGR_PEP_ID=MMETSP0101-20121206/10988_1 /TAXON_ID=38822 ORGANISM="Pteridomonas danica, Strain PT" /NCGR_SAMPLE_ID=MMETSP0101 /ASSEMBLY_ACC=CAM_ASM_000211 /LENGTH=220 /DNA_ID=CAMNT_0001478923 /DNA_START=81 /DNA_END=740 /DNA_ORIENTATION=+
MPPRKTRKREAAIVDLVEASEKAIYNDDSYSNQLNASHLDESLNDILVEVNKRCTALMANSERQCEQLDHKLATSLARLPKKIKSMKMNDFLAQSENFNLPNSFERVDEIPQTQKKIPLGSNARENINIISATPVQNKQQPISLQTPGVRVQQFDEVVYSKAGSPIVSAAQMTSWTAKKARDEGERIQVNVLPQNSPGTQSKIDNDPELKKKYDQVQADW